MWSLPDIRNLVDQIFLFLDVLALKLRIFITILLTYRPEKFFRLSVQQKIKLP